MNRSSLFIISTLFFCLLIVSISGAVVLESVWQKSFESKIMDAVFVSDSSLVVATSKEVIYLDQDKQVRQSYSLKKNQYTVLSENGEVFGIITHHPQAKEIIEKIELFNQEGSQLCFLNENGYPFLSPDGRWLIVVSKFKDALFFYDNKGNLLNKYASSDLYGLSLAFSPDSHYCIVNIPNIQEGKTSGFLILFDKSGKRLWQFDHLGSTVGEVTISKDANNIVYSSENEVYSLNKNGEIKWQNSISAGGILIDLSKNGTLLALGRRQDNSLSLYNALDGSLIWKEEIKGLLGYNSPFTSLELTEDGVILATIAKSWSLKNNESYLYILKGKEILFQAKYNQQSIKAQINKDNNIILMAFDRLVIYNIFY